MRKLILLVIMFFAFSIYAKTLCIVTSKKNKKASNLNVYEVKQIFLKDKKNWKHGKKIKAYNFENNTDERIFFQSNILKMTKDEEEKYWNDMKVKIGLAPPGYKKNKKIIKKLVEKVPASISYLFKEDVSKKMRVLLEISK